MTRAEIKLLARQLIQETLGSATEGDVFSLDAMLNTVTDEVASLGDIFYVPAPGIDIVAGTSRYVVPIHHVVMATALSSTGVERNLTTIDPARMDRLYTGWRNTAAADIGSVAAAPNAYAVIEGGGVIRLWPPPSTNRTGGLQLEGFGAPCGAWPNETDTCPLPIWTHRAIAYNLAVERCVQYADVVSDRKAQRLSDRADKLMQVVLGHAEIAVQGVGKGKETSPKGRKPTPAPVDVAAE